MTVLLHRPGRRGAAEGEGAAALLARALGDAVAARAAAGGLAAALGAGEGAEGAWALAAGGDLLALPAAALARAVVLPRLDPRWSLEDPTLRPLESLPAGTAVVAGSDLGVALLLRARPDLRPVRAGAFPLPEETPVLAEGPFEGSPTTRPLDPAAFLPAPGTGLAALLPPRGEDPPAAARALEDGEARTALVIERALAEGAGPLPPGAALGAMARRKVSVLFGLRAVLFVPGRAPRELKADIPLADARQFARSFGKSIRPEPDPY